tara:strand:- start:1535 stop:1801 length:267 start_codon:yes stop_codon:yes gene_type:complete
LPKSPTSLAIQRAISSTPSFILIFGLSSLSNDLTISKYQLLLNTQENQQIEVWLSEVTNFKLSEILGILKIDYIPSGMTFSIVCVKES